MRNIPKNNEIPPEMPLKYKQIIVKIYEAEDLVKMDYYNKNSDPYIQATIGQFK